MTHTSRLAVRGRGGGVRKEEREREREGEGGGKEREGHTYSSSFISERRYSSTHQTAHENKSSVSCDLQEHVHYHKLHVVYKYMYSTSMYLVMFSPGKE